MYFKRHKNDIKALIGGESNVFNEDTTIQELMETDLHMHEEDIYSVITRAEKERAIESSLKDVEECWKTIKLPLRKLKLANNPDGPRS